MRLLTLLPIGCVALYATLPNPTADARLIDRLDRFVQQRFAAPVPGQFGMSRAARPSSLGEHFQPETTAAADFVPSGAAEKELIRDLESGKMQVGLYVFGAAVVHSPADLMDFRALKGPAAITSGTPRPAWYPPLAPIAPKASTADALPDWNAIYSVARDAMKHFDQGGKGLEASLGSWQIKARPVPASAAACLGCHNNPAIGRSKGVMKLNQPVGGVIYAFRRG